MQMTEEEIVESYRRAKKKREQIQILAELNACTIEEIADILKAHGVDYRSFSKMLGDYKSGKMVHQKTNIQELSALRKRIEELVAERDRIDNELGEIAYSIEQLLDTMRLK